MAYSEWVNESVFIEKKRIWTKNMCIEAEERIDFVHEKKIECTLHIAVVRVLSSVLNGVVCTQYT